MSKTTRLTALLDQIEKASLLLVKETSRAAAIAEDAGYADPQAIARSVQTRYGRIAGSTRRDLTAVVEDFPPPPA